MTINTRAEVLAKLAESLRSGLLFGSTDEPLDDYGKRIVRVIHDALATVPPQPASQCAHGTRGCTADHEATLVCMVPASPQPASAGPEVEPGESEKRQQAVSAAYQAGQASVRVLSSRLAERWRNEASAAASLIDGMGAACARTAQLTLEACADELEAASVRVPAPVDLEALADAWWLGRRSVLDLTTATGPQLRERCRADLAALQRARETGAE
jgi:hypothetical protein